MTLMVLLTMDVMRRKKRDHSYDTTMAHNKNKKKQTPQEQFQVSHVCQTNQTSVPTGCRAM